MKKLLQTMSFSLLCCFLHSQANAALFVTIIEGLEGMAEYGDSFHIQRELAVQASIALTGEERVTAISGENANREDLLIHFDNLAKQLNPDDRAAIYLIGHGSFDGEEYKFNIPGPDITARDLSTIVNSLPGSNHLLVNTSSTSGAMLESILENKEDNIILISATRNGNERNATEFGRFFMEGLNSEEADLNKNNLISVQEAFDYAERKVSDFYEGEGKLATEHPQIRGELSSAFNLGQVVAINVTSTDPEVSRLIEERRSIDEQIENLQLNRSDYSNSEYTQRLRELILNSAEVLEQLDALQSPEEN